MKLVALVGMTGSGKTEISNLIKEKGFIRIRFGDITDEILEQKGLALNEDNERSFRENIRKEHGMAAYAKLNLEKIQNALKTKSVVIDGLYSWEEYLYLKEKLPKIIIVAVYSSPKQRYERLENRKVRPLTKEQSSTRDVKEIKNLNKAPPIAMADYTILNVGTMFDLENNVSKFMEWLNQNEKA